MDQRQVYATVREAGSGLRLLEHPFYTRWSRGELGADELARYAEQYRHFERHLPLLLARVIARIDDPTAAELVARNLRDEAGSEPTHAQRFERFAEAVGARTEQAPGRAMGQLLALYDTAVTEGPATALAALAAYEDQAREVAATKAEGLRAHFGLDGEAVRFWDLHAELDGDHAAWAVEAISHLAVDQESVHRGARRASQAWWAFLDEREAELSVA